MEIAIVGLGHAFSKQYNALKQIKQFENIELCDKDDEKIKKYKCESDFRLLKSKNIILATSPTTHLSIFKELIKSGKNVIMEKPVVTTLEELKVLEQKGIKEKYYNSLHFSFGVEIDYFLKIVKEKPKKIYSYISDNYVLDNKIKSEAIPLGGSYLDEVINPLSAISRIFGYNINFKKNYKKKYKNDKLDYYSKTEFLVDNIPTIIEVLWNDKKSQKYIDLFYEDCVIRLDSMKQSVIDITNNKILFLGKGDRMTNHYVGVFKDYLKNGSNYELSMKLHKEFLKGVD